MTPAEPPARAAEVTTAPGGAPADKWRRRILSSVATHVAAQLALALLPIGAIAIYQTWQITHEESRRLEESLLSATAEAAAGEALAIARATGAVQVLAAHVAEGGANASGPACSEIFAASVQATPQYSFAGFADENGILQCASASVGFDARGGAVYAAMQNEQKLTVVANRDGPISGTSVIISAAPVFFDGTYGGYVAISVPHTRIHDVVNPALGTAPEDDLTQLRLLTFNADGLVLSAAEDEARVAGALPEGVSLASLVGRGQWAFSATSQAGDARAFAVVPIIPGVIYALGSWPARNMGWARVSPLLFPGVMLLAGLAVAYFAVDRLVIRRIRELGRQMRAFSVNRRVLTFADRDRLPSEFAQIDETWHDLAEHLLRDEAELENMVHEKNVLLKEVHHRVKNNLQLIASIVNLKIRRAKSEEARRVLSEVRMRVQSIASVHQALYSGPSASTLQSSELLESVVGATIEAGTSTDRPVTITRHFDDVPLYPDQAVPFLLLASEAVTNALKYIGTPPGGAATLTITLKAPEAGAEADARAEFRVVNSVGVPIHPQEQVKGSGLGRSLLAGFAAQIGGTVETLESDTAYDFRASFRPAAFDPAESDAALTEAEDEAEAVGG